MEPFLSISDALLHVVVLVIGLWIGLFIERHKAGIFSRYGFWNRKPDLQGSYTTHWTINAAAGTEIMISDLVEITHAAGNYFIGSGSNAQFGKYHLSGRYTEDALSFGYVAEDHSQKSRIGAGLVVRRGTGDYDGYWSQYYSGPQRPAEALFGKVAWTKRP